MNNVWDVVVGMDMEVVVKEGEKVDDCQIIAVEKIIEGVEVDKKLLKTLKSKVAGKARIGDGKLGIEYSAVEIMVESVVGGNIWAEGIVVASNWKGLDRNKIENKLVLMENPDDLTVAKCGALGASGLIIKNNAKIESWMPVITVDLPLWNKLMADAGSFGKIWVDEANGRLLKVL